VSRRDRGRRRDFVLKFCLQFEEQGGVRLIRFEPVA
jgi:hypothetical protein